MMKSLCWYLGLLLVLYLQATAQAEDCIRNQKQASLIKRVSSTLSQTPPSQREWLLEQADCRVDKYPNWEIAFDACSCAPTFGCAMVSVLRTKDLLSATDPVVLECGR
jgi:hypothetical protein